MAISDDVKIGDFSTPIAPRKTSDAALPASPKDTQLAGAEAAIDKEAAQVEQTLGPLEAYEKRLKEIGVTREDAASMVDTLLERGYWSEDVAITSRIKARFRTRQYRDVERLRNYIEVVRPQHPDYYNDILWKYQLAASIEMYKTTVFKHPSRNDSKDEVEKLFQARLTFVDEMGDPMFRMLGIKLAKFDEKVRNVFEEGAIEVF